MCREPKARPEPRCRDHKALLLNSKEQMREKHKIATRGRKRPKIEKQSINLMSPSSGRKNNVVTGKLEAGERVAGEGAEARRYSEYEVMKSSSNRVKRGAGLKALH